MLASKACRGAIMFGDELTHVQVGAVFGWPSRAHHPHYWTIYRPLCCVACLIVKRIYMCHLALPCLQCQELVDSLAATKLCFSCAHGRPTVAPLADLGALRRALRLRAEATLLGSGGGGRTSGGVWGGATQGGFCGSDGSAGLAGLKGKLQSLLQS